MVMFFDFSSMPPADQLRAQKSALTFLESQMTSADMVSIMSFATKLEVKQDFTSDRDKLAEVIQAFKIGEASELAADTDNTDEETGEDTGDAFLADESEFNIFNTDQKLAALESATKMLAALPEKKALIYFSGGVGKTGVENQSQIRSTINAAVRANVAFYPVDARGLVAMPPGGDASRASSRGSGIFTGGTQRQQQSRFQDQQETLVTLAADTGGKALLDTNDLGAGFVQAQNDIQSYYILGYYSSNEKLDGRYRRVQVKMASNPQAKLDYRGGYFGPKQFGQFTSADKENQLQEALMLGDPITDLPLALEVNWFRLSRDRYFVPIAVKVPGSEIALARRGSAETTEFDFIGQVRDARGTPGRQRARRHPRQAHRRQRRAARPPQPAIRFRLHAPAGAIQPEVPRAREPDRQDGHLRNEVRHTGPQQPGRGPARQLGGVEQPAGVAQARPSAPPK